MAQRYDAFQAWRKAQCQGDSDRALILTIHNAFLDDFMAMQRLRIGTRTPWLNLMHSGALDCWGTLLCASNHRGGNKKGRVNYVHDVMHFYRRYFVLAPCVQRAIDLTLVASPTGEAMHWLAAEEMSEMTVRSDKSVHRSQLSGETRTWQSHQATGGRRSVSKRGFRQMGCLEKQETKRSRRQRDQRVARQVTKRVAQCMPGTLDSAEWRFAQNGSLGSE